MSPVECTYCGLPVPGASPSAERLRPEPQYCCYGCRLAAKVTRQDGPEAAPTLARTRTLLGLAIFLSMNVMVVNWMLYGQEVYNPDGAPSGLSAATIALFRYLSLFFAAPVLAILGWPILLNGLRRLRRALVTADLLIALGAGAAFVYSYISVMREAGGTYFDTVCMILVLVTLGRYLEATAKIKTTRALHELETLLPQEAILVRGHAHVPLPTRDLAPGDVVLVKPGCRIPADGVIAAHESCVDEQLITGESEPVFKRQGDTVYAGALNGEGGLLVRVQAVGPDTVLHEVIDLLVAARRSKGKYQRLADRLAAVFVPGVLGLAVVAAVLAYRRAGVDDAIMRALAVLLISCPCALGLATPMAVWVALGRAARRGVLFRNVVALEALAGVKTVCFDKTGTLTTGRAVVTSFDTSGDGTVPANDVLARAGGLARGSTHHFSQAITRYVAERGVEPEEIGELKMVPGRGVTGVRTATGSTVSLGSAAFMDENGLARCSPLDGAVSALREAGRSLACIGWGGAVRGVFSFAEDTRPEVRGTLKDLRKRGVAPYVLTGDHPGRARRLSDELGVETEAELLPADKVERLKRLAARRGPVAMVGDGINDAPALAAAAVGIAMGCGADVTRESADITLASDDLRALAWSMDLSARTVRVIRQNLFWAFAYNSAGIGLAMTGRLSPIFAAAAMVVSSLLVVTNSLRLNRSDAATGQANGARVGNEE